MVSTLPRYAVPLTLCPTEEYGRRSRNHTRMDNRFRDYDLSQAFLLPPALQDWLPEKHLARIMCAVLDEIDLSAFYAPYGTGAKGGRPAYHPLMMVRLLAYGYCTGTFSSRKLEAETHNDIAFRFLAANQHPDHDTIAAFRKQNLHLLEAVFDEVLGLCAKAGMVKLGHVATDGSKVQANASKHKAMSYERMQQIEGKLEGEISTLRMAAARELLEKAEQIDAEEDAKYGSGNSGDGIPEELARRETRVAAIRKAKAALEEEARAKAAEHAMKKAKQEDERNAGTDGNQAPTVDPGQADPDPKAQYNFTDPESRIMVDGASKRFVQAYNTQISVDAEHQIIVAAKVTQDANDKRQLIPMLEAVEESMGRMPDVASADSGYFSEQNVSAQRLDGVDLYIPPERQKHGHQAFATCAKVLTLPAMNILGVLFCRTRTRKISRHTKQLQEHGFLVSFATTVTLVAGPCLVPLGRPTMADTMRYKLRAPDGKTIYSRRKTIVEPVYGQIKGCQGFRRFSLRGLRNVVAEWKFVAAMHNLMKLFRFRTRKHSPLSLSMASAFGYKAVVACDTPTFPTTYVGQLLAVAKEIQ